MLALISICGVAQEKKNQTRKPFSPEQYKAEMECFITKDACLSEEEAKKFFPILHEMLEKQRKNNDKSRELMMQCNNDKSTEADYERAVSQSIALDKENKEIELQYYTKFHCVLSWKKIHKVRIALFKFNMYSLRRFSPPHKRNNGTRSMNYWNRMRKMNNNNSNNNNSNNSNNN